MVRFKTRWLLLAIDDRPQADTLRHRQRGADSNGPRGASTLTPQVITRLLRASLLNNFGDVAAGSFGGVLNCKYYSSHTGTAIVRCPRDGARFIWAAATLISSATELPPPSTATPCMSSTEPSLRIRVVHCGGTIKKLQTKAIELDRRIILRLRNRQAQRDLSHVISDRSLHSVAAPSAPFKPAMNDEDLGETLDAPTEALPSSSGTQTTSPISKVTHQDPETANLLATSKKEITSITM